MRCHDLTNQKRPVEPLLLVEEGSPTREGPGYRQRHAPLAKNGALSTLGERSLEFGPVE